MLETLTELRLEGTIASPPEVTRPADDPNPLVRCRVSVDMPAGGDPEDREARRLPVSALSLTVVATFWQVCHELERCGVGDEVRIEGELRRNPRDGRLELWADLIHRHPTEAELCHA